jgi:hypothetical protein
VVNKVVNHNYLEEEKHHNKHCPQGKLHKQQVRHHRKVNRYHNNL